MYSVAIPVGGGLAIALGGLVAQAIGTAGSVTLPLFGEMRGWQAAFLTIGAASFLALPLLMTLPEPAARSFGRVEVAGETTRAFFRRRRTLVWCYFGAMSVLTLMAYSNVAWFPSYLIRVHGLDRAQVGLAYGSILAVAGTAGLVIGGLVSDRLVRAGRADGHLLVAIGATVLAIVPGILIPLSGSAQAALWLMVPLVFFGAIPTGATATMTQLIAPPALRGMIVAIFLLCINLVGFGIGPVSVGLLNDRVFGDPLAIGRSMSIVIAFGTVGGAILFCLARQPYRQALAEIDAARA